MPVAVAGGLGARSALDRVRVRSTALPALALPALVLGLTFSPLIGRHPPAAGSPMDRLTACTAALPKDAPLAADDSAAAPLAARPVERPLTWARTGDWVVVDRAGYQPGYVDRRGRSALLAAIPGQNRRLSCDDGRFRVWTPARHG